MQNQIIKYIFSLKFKKLKHIICFILIQVLCFSSFALSAEFNVLSLVGKEDTYTLAPRLFISNFPLQDNVLENSIASQRNDLFSADIKDLMVDLELAMPFCRADNQNWSMFNSLVSELKGAYGQNVLVIKGSNMNSNDVQCDFQYEPGRRDLPQVMIMAKKFIKKTKITNLGRNGKFLTIAAQNVEQHVKEGIALLTQEVVDKDTLKIALMDNGTGLIDREGNRVSIEQAIKKDHSFGKGGGEGKGLNYLIGKYSQLTVIEQPGEYAIIIPDENYANSFELNIVDAGANNKMFGTVVTGYFYTGTGNMEVWRDKLCDRIKTEIRIREFTRGVTAVKRSIAVEYWMQVEELDNKILVNDQTGEIRFIADDPVVDIDFNLFTIRHGRTKANISPLLFLRRKAAEINQLDTIGKEQAKETAESLFFLLKDEIKKGNVVVVTSDFDRSVETTNFFIRFVKEKTGIALDVKKEKMARERSYGDFFRTLAELFQKRHKNDLSKFRHLLVQAANTLFSRPKGGESFLDVLIRSKNLLAKLNEKYKGKTVLLFGHGEQSSAIRTLLCDKTIVTEEGHVAWRRKMLNNAEYRVFNMKKVEKSTQNHDIIIQEVQSIMEKKLGEKFTANIHHGLKHSVDLLEKAKTLVAKLDKENAVDWKVLAAAIYMHDIFAEDSELHGQQAADFIEQNFRENDIFTDEQIEKIKQAVAFHDKKIPEDASAIAHDLNLETKILYDVDNLDAFGIKGIYRYFAAHISRGLVKKRSAEQVIAHIKQRVVYNVEQRRNNLYFKQSRQLADAEFPMTKMFFDKLVKEDYSVGSKKGATGVFTFIWENFQDMPWDIAKKAIKSLEQEGQKIKNEFTQNYFEQLIQVYEKVDKQVKVMPEYNASLKQSNLSEIFELIERAI